MNIYNLQLYATTEIHSKILKTELKQKRQGTNGKYSINPFL